MENIKEGLKDMEDTVRRSTHNLCQSKGKKEQGNINI